ncbi:GTP-binding protein [Actinotalea sp. BY-33]|uniref:GTP-binding protein n=1 Tax=Actinotalea soli TaxID=2819234 RepID=A0A939RUX5_9CELL|nr:GTP-binding protein [Actinotalea soli]MBO1751810.1 GTP-binding protein [Actinotalea soli]
MAPRLPLTVLATIDPVLRDSAVMGLVTDTPATVVLRHDILEDAMGDGVIRRVVIDGSGVVEDERVPLEHACLSCAVREDAVPTLRRLASDGRWDALALALPVSAESLPVTRALSGATSRGGELPGVRLASVLAVVDVETVVEDLLGDDLLEERDLALTGDDRRSVGEALAAQLAHADLVLTTGDVDLHPQGSDLVDHTRARDGLRQDGLHDLDVRGLLSTRHSSRRGEARLDPVQAAPSRSTSASGVWTIELEDDRPVHPERFVDHVAALGSGRLRSRGVFWVADRPEAACAWDGAGGQLSIGTLGPWGRGRPVTRLVVTGTGDEAPRLRAAFERVLLTPEEMRRGPEAWAARHDALEPWLGARESL